MKEKNSSIKILHVKVSLLTKQQVLVRISKSIEKGRKTMVVTPNPEQVMLAQKDRYFRKILNKAFLALCDGVGLIWAGRVLYPEVKMPGRVTGEETMRSLIELAKFKGWRVMLLGGRAGVAKQAAEKIKNSGVMADNCSLQFKIVGSEGMRNIKRFSYEENEQVIREINRFKPDMLFVGYGAPWQEKWLFECFSGLEIKLGMGVGGALDMIADSSLRPPGLISQLHLDWFYRLLRQPWRVKRQLALVSFILQVLREKDLRVRMGG